MSDLEGFEWLADPSADETPVVLVCARCNKMHGRVRGHDDKIRFEFRERIVCRHVTVGEANVPAIVQLVRDVWDGIRDKPARYLIPPRSDRRRNFTDEMLSMEERGEIEVMRANEGEESV